MRKLSEEQLMIINYSVQTQLRLLDSVKQTYHDNICSEKFITLKTETKTLIIHDLENYLLLPEYSFKPIARKFQPQDDVIRHEIVKEVDRLFKIHDSCC